MSTEERITPKDVLMAGLAEFQRAGVPEPRATLFHHVLAEGLRFLGREPEGAVRLDPVFWDGGLCKTSTTDSGRSTFYSPALCDSLTSFASCSVFRLGRSEFPHLGLGVADTVALGSLGALELQIRASQSPKSGLEVIIEAAQIPVHVALEGRLLDEYEKGLMNSVRDFRNEFKKYLDNDADTTGMII
ncbi:MAG: hypothetical protein PHW75_03680 [Patescibacteria group bacterium]|nr:hypothetical protein [Patescibacteria group bacterium]